MFKFLHLRVYLSDQLFQKTADERSYFVTIQQVETSLRVSVVINYSVSITIKGTAAISLVNLNALTHGREKNERHFLSSSNVITSYSYKTSIRFQRLTHSDCPITTTFEAVFRKDKNIYKINSQESTSKC